MVADIKFHVPLKHHPDNLVFRGSRGCITRVIQLTFAAVNMKQFAEKK